MIADPELAEAVDAREHWQLDHHGALYAPPGALALVRVQPVHQPTRHERYAATIVQAGVAVVYAVPCRTAAEAVRWAERARLT